MTSISSPAATQARPRASTGIAALVGVVSAGLALGVAQLVAAFVRPQSAPVLAIGSAFIDRVPPWLKDTAIRLFGTNDKLVLLASMALVVTLLAALAGVAERWRRGVGLALVVLFGVVAVGAAVTRAGAGPFDAAPSVIGFAAGGVALRLLVERLRAVDGANGSPSSSSPTRRSVLAATAWVAAAAASAAAAGRALSGAARDAVAARAGLRLPAPAVPASAVPAGVENGVVGTTPYLTPNADFYRIDTALTVPSIDPATWSLRVHGLVEEEVEISFEELLALPMAESRVTLTCVSNEVGGGLAGNATWLGVPIAAVLERARPQAGADMVLSRSSDGFSASTPLSALTDRDRGALLAVGMNGEPLPLEHGFPVRMVVPGLYGFVSATKWVVDLEVTRFADATAYWTTRGWSDQGPIKTASRIDVPKGFAQVAQGTVPVGGVAWAQTRGISAVEVQVDDGPWQPATLAAQDGLDTWRQWSYAWDAAAAGPGAHTLRVRAVDGTGAVQVGERAAPAPDGATGWHSVSVTVQ
ncbi:DMSO/TMAO reductase YedYZ, molybdopterin-dependent catalytic subunit [Quadrisphaera granulorum]|uniref:DMSO/TMAO reductase YedYZ molybdopterin-dependent catalytic subunit n=1 Tax=Quadrisphaera granulorum TaxID=317664 RepID=A0A316AC72_9ACTN|nr:molybdopterin-dependent oxidoreductase [Quadrisphaera granulorum]PWJ55182.1 DMSO/TMAO reductase YedYZ molybdopterin-dependent catalytic subunit [Quadrisphaera granulorum]SZE95691.1 DMSO/TMAO reductase YedYZ, molybdopterin-dependent catalytic subunit [Quadrisphaera granulorum]